MVKDTDHASQNFFLQIFEESVSIKISTCQNFCAHSYNRVTVHFTYTHHYMYLVALDSGVQ